MPNADLVLEGGGMKGLGAVGAAIGLMERGYTFPRVAGTSAGSILAAFLAAGVDAATVREVMGRLDYSRVPDLAPPRIPIASEGISLVAKGGAHPGDYVHQWIRAELERLGVSTFGDLRLHDQGADANLPASRRYKLVVITTDITHGLLLRLPWDYEQFALDPDKQLVADAVRASMSIPLYFTPQKLRHQQTGAESTIVDGGVLSNFPVEIFDRTDGRDPRWPTFGVKIIPALPGADAKLFPPLALPMLPPVRELEQVVVTAIVGHDQSHIERPSVQRRTIEVDTSSVGIVEFDADKKKRDGVVESGRAAVERFLAGWELDEYGAKYWTTRSIDEPLEGDRSSISKYRMAVRLATDVERLNALDDFWTTYLADQPEREEVERDLPGLRVMVEEMRVLLDAIARRSTELRTAIAELPADLDDELRRVLPAHPLGGALLEILPEGSFTEQVLAACTIVEQDAPSARDKLSERLNDLADTGRAKGDLSGRLKCAILLVGGGASLLATEIASSGMAGATVGILGGGGSLVATLTAAYGWTCRRAGDVASLRDTDKVVSPQGRLIADELAKLANLRDRGDLTEEEFASAKATLLP
jgi:predicted acylesterase/phospholipase RssA